MSTLISCWRRRLALGTTIGETNSRIGVWLIIVIIISRGHYKMMTSSIFGAIVVLVAIEMTEGGGRYLCEGVGSAMTEREIRGDHRRCENALDSYRVVSPRWQRAGNFKRRRRLVSKPKCRSACPKPTASATGRRWRAIAQRHQQGRPGGMKSYGGGSAKMGFAVCRRARWHD